MFLSVYIIRVRVRLMAKQPQNLYDSSVYYVELSDQTGIQHQNALINVETHNNQTTPLSGQSVTNIVP